MENPGQFRVEINMQTLPHREKGGRGMSEAPKSPAQVINDLSDQVRLLRQDVVNLTAIATTKTEAAALRTAVQTSVKEAEKRSAKVLDAAERVIDRSYQANLQAARDGAAKAVAGL